VGNPKRTKFNRMAVNHGGCPSFRHQKNKGSSLEFITESLRKHKLCGKTLVVVGQDILLLLVSRPTILLLLKDRTFQIWKRNSMSIDLIHEWFFKQKFEYLHNNPCQPHWQLATLSEDYKYSSASFYDTGEDRFGFLTHHSEI
jgi:hypothetical protein